MERRRWLSDPPKTCQLCHRAIRTAFVDGATRGGPWANMCLPCHASNGYGLGTGQGQRYDLDDDGNWYKHDPTSHLGGMFDLEPPRTYKPRRNAK
jgi:hypothetical protein